MRFRSVANSWPNLLGRGPILRHFVFLSLIGVVLAGCHKKPAGGSASSPVSEGAAGDPAATPAPKLPPAPPSVTANAKNNVQQKVEGEVDPFLTGQLRAFVEKNHRVPQTFYEFSVRSLDSMPRPPEGKRWAIDASDVTVKAVPK